jgi:hypothetical protein
MRGVSFLKRKHVAKCEVFTALFVKIRVFIILFACYEQQSIFHLVGFIANVFELCELAQ